MGSLQGQTPSAGSNGIPVYYTFESLFIIHWILLSCHKNHFDWTWLLGWTNYDQLQLSVLSVISSKTVTFHWHVHFTITFFCLVHLNVRFIGQVVSFYCHINSTNHILLSCPLSPSHLTMMSIGPIILNSHVNWTNHILLSFALYHSCYNSDQSHLTVKSI